MFAGMNAVRRVVPLVVLVWLAAGLGPVGSVQAIARTPADGSSGDLPRARTAHVDNNISRAAPLPRPVRLARPLEGVVTTSVADWDRFTGHTAQLADNYVAMARNGGVLPSRWLRSAIRADDGAEPVIEILPNDATTPVITLSSIARGQHDSWLLALKAQIAALGRPVVISFAPEPNGKWYSWGRQPKEFVAAYQHVHDIIRDGTGAAPVTWMWQPSAINQQAEPMPGQYRLYWPGARFVELGGAGWVLLRQQRQFQLAIRCHPQGREAILERPGNHR